MGYISYGLKSKIVRQALKDWLDKKQTPEPFPTSKPIKLPR
jgi:hypothetical protein